MAIRKQHLVINSKMHRRIFTALLFSLTHCCPSSAFAPEPIKSTLHRSNNDFGIDTKMKMKGQIKVAAMPKQMNELKEPLQLNPHQSDAINEFVSQVNQALMMAVTSSSSESSEEGGGNENLLFHSFTLTGPKAPRKTKTMNDSKRKEVEEQKKILLGRMRQVTGRLISLRSKKKKKNTSPSSSLYLQLTIRFFGATDVAKNWDLQDDKIDIKQEMLQLIEGSGDSSNISEWGKVNNKSGLNFRFAELELSNGIWKLDMTKKKAKCTFLRSKKKATIEIKNNASPVLSHDQQKNFLLSPKAPFFQKLGITDANGKPKKARSSKFRQCQKFTEIVSGLVDDSFLSLLNNKDDGEISLEEGKPSIITHDMGCGRGYLTFALHSHLHNQFSHAFDIQSRGVDMRPKLVKEINGIASELGSDFDGLRFMTGTIGDTDIDKNDNIDMLIALHACDTATDDSIWYGMQREASIIVTAPCCHKEVRRYLNAHVAKAKDHPYAEILRHNIYKERIAETLTDSMRALLLEIADYDIQVFEFIGGEHTSKNVMITAKKRKRPRVASQKKQLRSRLKSLAQLHGVKKQKLASLMNEILDEDDSTDDERIRRNIAHTGMPSL